MIPEERRISQHPVDRLIRELIRTRRPATDEEVDQILERIAAAEFDPRVIPVPRELRGRTYQGRTLGTRDEALFIHVAKRVLVERQWQPGTTEAEYLVDIRSAVRSDRVRLAVYGRRGGSVAMVFAENPVSTERRDRGSHPWMVVVYSADRGTIVSGYQVSDLDTVSTSGDALWLK